MYDCGHTSFWSLECDLPQAISLYVVHTKFGGSLGVFWSGSLIYARMIALKFKNCWKIRRSRVPVTIPGTGRPMILNDIFSHQIGIK